VIDFTDVHDELILVIGSGEIVNDPTQILGEGKTLLRYRQSIPANEESRKQSFRQISLNPHP
jgi:hypothetical protein